MFFGIWKQNTHLNISHFSFERNNEEFQVTSSVMICKLKRVLFVLVILLLIRDYFCLLPFSYLGTNHVTIWVFVVLAVLLMGIFTLFSQVWLTPNCQTFFLRIWLFMLQNLSCIFAIFVNMPLFSKSKWKNLLCVTNKGKLKWLNFAKYYYAYVEE